MAQHLLIDIGAGTMDVMLADADSGRHTKAVVASPVLTLAAAIERLEGDLVVTGCEMGGGTVTRALRAHLAKGRVTIGAAAADTIHHDPQRVAAQGFHIVDEADARRRAAAGGGTHVELADLQPARLNALLDAMGVPLDIDAVGVCAQDHGVPPPGVSHLDFRHQLFRRVLQDVPDPRALLFAAGDLPPAYNRLRAIAASAGRLPARRVYVMDSGMAAILGACQDPASRALERIVVLDVATSHTVAAAVQQGELAGFVEYHTRDVTAHGLDDTIRRLCDGDLDHTRVLAEGGHGAYIRDAFGFDNLQGVIATGPKRDLLADSALAITPGAPWGDNMMTGTVGLLEAIRHRDSAGR